MESSSETDPLGNDYVSQAYLVAALPEIKSENDILLKIKEEKDPDAEHNIFEPNVDINEPQKEKKKRKRKKCGSIEENPDGIPFYACAVCNVKYTNLQHLQNHVTEHKDRLTSWDLRVKNMKLKKKLKKEKKRMKKIKVESLIKQEIKEEPEVPLNFSEYLQNMSEDIKDMDVNLNNDRISNDNSVLNSENGSLSNDNKVLDNTNECLISNNEGLSSGTCVESVGNIDNGIQSTSISSTKNNGEGPNEDAMKKEFSNGADPNLEKIFKCGTCEKQFSLGYYLKLHVRSHTGEKPYTCAECGLSFITASKLGRHTKRTHLAVRFVCRVCRRPYTRLEFLTRHFNKHHADDKIENEPYDYNAILPYLKELEAELEQKKQEEEKQRLAEKEAELREQFKSEPEWLDLRSGEGDLGEIKVEQIEPPPLEEAPPVPGSSPEPAPDDAFDNEPMQFSDPSDEEYFPDNTWVSPVTPSPQKTPKDPQYSCPHCSKPIRSKAYLKVHLRTHSAQRPYRCPVCDKGFITSAKMNRHVITHPEWNGEKLEMGESDIKEELPEEGDESVPKKKKRRKRKSPSSPTVKLESDESSSQRKPRKRPHACEFCGKKFLYLEALQVHMHTHSGESRSFSCRFCLSPAEDEATLQQHESEHNGPRPYLCTICGRQYQKRESMLYHRRQHSAPKAFQCERCPRTFSANCKLQRHRSAHCSRSTTRYDCPVCAHSFRTRYHVTVHLNTHAREGLIHEENRNQVLAMVLQNVRKIPVEGSGEQGDEPVEQDERSRVCNICGEVFNHFYYLEQHLKSHASKLTELDQEEEKKHICKVCNKGFKLSYYLKLHTFTHTKEKPFICQQCGKGFITKGKLKRHLETHAGLKKYQCHICCKFFTRPSYLRIHVRTIHGTQDYNFKTDFDYDGVPDGMGMVSNE